MTTNITLTSKDLDKIRELVKFHRYHTFRDTVIIVADTYADEILIRNVKIMNDESIPMYEGEVLIEFYGRENFIEDYKEDADKMSDHIVDVIRKKYKVE